MVFHSLLQLFKRYIQIQTPALAESNMNTTNREKGKSFLARDAQQQAQQGCRKTGDADEVLRVHGLNINELRISCNSETL